MRVNSRVAAGVGVVAVALAATFLFITGQGSPAAQFAATSDSASSSDITREARTLWKDGFNDGNLDEWYRFEPQWTTTTSPAVEGSHSATATLPGTSDTRFSCMARDIEYRHGGEDVTTLLPGKLTWRWKIDSEYTGYHGDGLHMFLVSDDPRLASEAVRDAEDKLDQLPNAAEREADLLLRQAAQRLFQAEEETGVRQKREETFSDWYGEHIHENGNTDWREASTQIQPGDHWLIFCASRDNESSGVSTWVDDIRLLATPPSPSELPSNVQGDDFESGTVAQWQHAGHKQWKISENAAAGTYSATSGNIGDNQFSCMYRDVTVGGTARLQFFWRASSEAGFDELRVYVDGVERAAESGTFYNFWDREELLLTSGSHELRFCYEKDWSISEGADRGWVDQISVEEVPPPTE